MRKGDSGKAYHVRKERKRKKKQEKEMNKLLDRAFTNALQRTHRHVKRIKKETRKSEE